MSLRLGRSLRRGHHWGRRLRDNWLRNRRWRSFYRTRYGRGSISTGFGNAARRRRLCQRLEERQVARLFRSRLHGRKRQIQLVFLGAGDPMQLPDQLIQLLRTTEIHVAVPQEPDGHYQHHGQSYRQRSEHNRDENRIEGSKRCIHRGPHCRISKL